MTRILVVDDSATLRRMVRAALQPLAGVEFTEADTGFAAIERLAFGPVSLIVLDLNMPDMHGVEVLRFVRAQPSYRHIPVIVLTTRDDETSRTASSAVLRSSARRFSTTILPNATNICARSGARS